MKFKPEIRHLILVAALVSTVYAEHRLAVWAGWDELIAWVLPGVADLYLIKATKDRRDMTYAILVVVALVSTSYAVTMPWDPVKTIISILVADLAPIVLWRLHITHDHKMEMLYGTETAQAVHRARDNGWSYELIPAGELSALRGAQDVPKPQQESSHGEHCNGNCGMTPEECRVCGTLPYSGPVTLTEEQQETVMFDYFTRGEKASEAAKAAGVSIATAYRRYRVYRADAEERALVTA